MLDALCHRKALTDARRIGHDDARPGVGIGLQHGTHGLLRVHVHADRGHVNSLVRHGQPAQVLLRRPLAALRKLGHGAGRSGLRSLTACVAVHLCIQHQDLHVLLAGDHVVQASVADVVCPAVAANNPKADAPKHVPQVVQHLELCVSRPLLLEQRLQPLHHLVIDAAAAGQQQVVLVLLAHDQELLQEPPELVAHHHPLVLQRILHL
mmetsp:Transcript_65587/g.170314  ORF Transcript_65587/g.170314 Transcript_65587/m.170314 type:complete len:208 (-) Transcript_65587:1669-2292(-)